MGEDFKPEAKCKYHDYCTLYNLNALTTDLEKSLCGRGQSVDENYEPYIPLPADFKPAYGYGRGPNAERCDAFMRHKDFELIGEIRDQWGRQMQLFEKHGYL